VPEQSLRELEAALSAEGVCNRERLIQELEDHLADLRTEAQAAGYSVDEAIDDAHRRLGTNANLLAAAVSACGTEIEYRDDILVLNTREWRRWSAAVCGGATLTLLMLFAMQLAIHST